MDAEGVLARYDAEIRADPPPEVGAQRTWVDGVLRTEGAYNFIGWWDFPAKATRAVVAREAAYFVANGVEWKLFSHDGPPGLEAALAAAGFTPDEPETFVALDLEAHAPPFDPPPGIEVRQVIDAAGAAVHQSISLRVR